jgi:hypothetical protein
MEFKATCRECRRRRDDELTVTMSKSGGGTYRRGGRRYSGQTCVQCIESTAQWLSTRDGEIDRTRGHAGYDTSGIVDALAELIERGHSDLDEARWHAMWLPDGHHSTFDEYFPLLRRAVEESLERRKRWRAAEAERRRRWRDEQGPALLP